MDCYSLHYILISLVFAAFGITTRDCVQVPFVSTQTILFETCKQGLASNYDIVVCFLKITCIPRVSDILHIKRVFCGQELEEQFHFTFAGTFEHPFEVLNIVSVHSYHVVA